jgi:8-amino-7-oxononanoate synthase
MQEEPQRIERLLAIAEKMRRGFQELGFDTGASQTPIIPVIIGEDMAMLQFWKALFDAGIYVNAVLPPAVPPGKALLRTSYMATHTDEQLDCILAAFEKVGNELGII